MLRAVSMTSKCAVGTTGEALLRRSKTQLQMLLQSLASAGCEDVNKDAESEQEDAGRAAAPAVRKGTKRRRFRSRNSVLDNWLADDGVSRVEAVCLISCRSYIAL
jgi:hypothetical protein